MFHMSGCMFDLRAYSSLQRNRACAGSPTCARCRVTSEDREVVLQRAVLLKHMSEFAANVFPFSILKLLSVLFHRKVNARGSVKVHRHSQECSLCLICILQQLVCVMNPMAGAVVTLSVDFEVRLLMLSCRGPISP